jgi:transcriptional regulator with XRE-family HTH domain
MNDTGADAADRWFGANLRRVRLAAGLSQGELATRMERELGRPYSQQTHSKIENGMQAPTLAVALALAKLVQIGLDILAREPETAQVAIELRRAAKETRDAHGLALAQTAAFLHWRAELKRLIDRAPWADDEDVADVSIEAYEASKLKLDWEG